ncbi:hypothetical protein J4E85_000478 [Alternaria conjuncta]|uniref:uncharacterized protein n=1 Tax=Alternaria conjuncta TaxID=181017 RepID=UPI00221F6822|nr:uncharacterized protein J4E85_000478 [Alternaria conjuncta]KAI4938039.1 hypothetical protein J4E85_000478 [Alternaria conjuncta]
MLICNNSFIGLLAGLSCISAAPLETLASESTSIAAHNTRNAPQFSLQLLYSVWDEDKYLYVAQRGKQGIAYGPCGGDEKNNSFELIHYTELGKDSRPNAIDHPPFPSKEVSFPIKVPGKKDCRYEGNGVDAGQIRCGDESVGKCGEDPQYDEPTIRCSWGTKYHRGYVCEF